MESTAAKRSNNDIHFKCPCTLCSEAYFGYYLFPTIHTSFFDLQPEPPC
jgi:hypothetical protein